MKDFLHLSDFTAAELQSLLDVAVRLKAEHAAGGNPPLLKGKVMGLIFQKPSLRTRVSFDMAMRHLGGDALYLSPNEIGLGKREAISDVARVLSGYVHMIMARVFDHAHILELARWSSVPVINGLSDYNHPCQGLADALTIYEKFGKLKGLNVTFLGDGNNVAVSLMHICARLGANFTLGSPENYDIRPDAVDIAQTFATESGSKLTFLRDPQAAAKDAHVIYTDTWTSMGQEEEARQREAIFPPFQVNDALMSLARPDAIFMHCLPAHRGQEVTDAVMDGGQSAVFPQAHNRLHAQKAVIARLFGVA